MQAHSGVGGGRESRASRESGATCGNRVYRFDRVLVGAEWQRDVEVAVDGRGRIAGVSTGVGKTRGERMGGWAVPGVPNVHSHSFQRALAGLAEGSGPGSFWSWREVMYRFADLLTPDDVEAVTAQLCIELLKAGFTCVGEFHYLHHAPGGPPYDDSAEISRRILAAARTAGIGLVLIPAVYESGGFGGQPLAGAQRRFRLSLDDAARLLDALGGEARDNSVGLGWGVHSLRAVSRQSFRELAALLSSGAGASAGTVHIHVAEQRREVRECVAERGARPVEWLLDHAPVDERWCLVHATHTTEAELAAIARRGAVAGLCPTTEANLGDGLFPLSDFAARGGRFGIGTDSHVSRSPVEELRLLDYGQRLVSERRVVLGDAGGAGGGGGAGGALAGAGGAVAGGRGALAGGHGTLPGGHGTLVGAGGALLRHAWRGGCQALAWQGGSIEEGKRADLVVLDAEHPALVGREGHAVLDSWVFSGTDNPVRDVMVAGQWVVKRGRHPREEAVRSAYAEAVKRVGARAGG